MQPICILNVIHPKSALEKRSETLCEWQGANLPHAIDTLVPSFDHLEHVKIIDGRSGSVKTTQGLPHRQRSYLPLAQSEAERGAPLVGLIKNSAVKKLALRFSRQSFLQLLDSWLQA